MRARRIRLGAACALFGATASLALADVFTSEFFSDPVSEGWELVLQYCQPETWNEGGWYHQVLDLDACPPGPPGGRDVYRRSLVSFDGVERFFCEFRIETNGDRSEIPWGAPIVVALGNNAGVIYHITVARNLVKFARDVDLPIWFIEIEPSVPHIYRIDLDANWYGFYIDGYLIDEGVVDGPFLAHDPSATWQGRSYYLPCHNIWDYFRYGHTAVDAGGDYDSDGAVSAFDYYFFQDCLAKDGPGIFGGPENNAGPGCRFADFDGDSDVDLLDFAEFANRFIGAHP